MRLSVARVGLSDCHGASSGCCGNWRRCSNALMASISSLKDVSSAWPGHSAALPAVTSRRASVWCPVLSPRCQSLLSNTAHCFLRFTPITWTRACLTLAKNTSVTITTSPLILLGLLYFLFLNVIFSTLAFLLYFVLMGGFSFSSTPCCSILYQFLSCW